MTLHLGSSTPHLPSAPRPGTPVALRRGACFALLGSLLLSFSSAHAESVPFSRAAVVDRARQMATEAYVSPRVTLPDWLAGLNYDQHRDIRFRPDQSVWGKEGLPFRLQFFHLGFLFSEPVQISLVKGGRAERVKYTPKLFDYGKNTPNFEGLENLGFAGFRVHAPMNRPDYFDEALVFLGASYFRSLGKDEIYGLSARGLAIDTATMKGEEFPVFKEFWIVEPEKKSDALVIHALLDSPSVVGAYRFVLKPGVATTIDVTATLFMRKDVGVLGLAPLTSMYLHGENDRLGVDDFRPEVHDNDGLLVWNGSGEKLWRPLMNPRVLGVSSFQVKNLKGFGLLQRDRAFTSYEDLEAHYGRRPSLWIEPTTDWPSGVVRLVEIPTELEIHDNIVSFFVPDGEVKQGQEMTFGYRMSWGDDVPKQEVVAAALATRMGNSETPGRRRVVIDFGPEPKAAAAAKTPARKGKKAPPPVLASLPVEPIIWTASGQVFNAVVQPNPATGGWRASFEFAPGKAEAVEMRVFLRRGGEAISETWSQLWTK